ncbi:MAG: cob(I)yrinic acid a,c-diamide adenosyltransferase [Melioribacteraceae bacterium]|nr:cob(I)yrinic acid a,c-diamide adenosyltransferase [Melioribacteraceae bacterium]
MKKSFIHIYTGNGKGKTTAAIGLAVRAAGAGYKTLFAMFMKSFQYSELRIMDKLKENIDYLRIGDDNFVLKKEPPSKSLKQEVKNALDKVYLKMMNKEYDIIVLDEICVSIYFKLITENEVLEFLKNKPDDVELILTGRYCPETFYSFADLVTEMKEVKHYYQKGILSRRGIDS